MIAESRTGQNRGCNRSSQLCDKNFTMCDLYSFMMSVFLYICITELWKLIGHFPVSESKLKSTITFFVNSYVYIHCFSQKHICVSSRPKTCIKCTSCVGAFLYFLACYSHQLLINRIVWSHLQECLFRHLCACPCTRY